MSPSYLTPYSSPTKRFPWYILALRFAIPPRRIEYPHWLGAMRSVAMDQTPRDYMSSGTTGTPSKDFLFKPFPVSPLNPDGRGSWLRRAGQTQKFDTFGSAAGMLPAKWSARSRQVSEFLSPSVTDGTPTISALLTKETIASGLDDGYFSNLWWRDQVNNQNRTMCDEFDTVNTYPSPGTIQYYRTVPLWYESGDGGITRGTSEFARRFMASGSRSYQQVGNWWYLPNRKGTPCRWNGTAASVGTLTSTATSNIDVSQITDEAGGAGDFSDLTTSGDGHYIRLQDDASRTAKFGLSGTISENTTYTVTIVAEKESAGSPNAGATFNLSLVTSNGHLYSTSTNVSTLTGSFATYAITITCNNLNGASGQTANSLQIGLNPNGGAHGYFFSVDKVTITSGTSTAMVNRIFPTGPIPPTHAGTLAASGAITANTARPDATINAGSWLKNGGAAATYIPISEATPDDTTYIYSNASNTAFTCSLGNPGYTPVVGDTVTVRFRVLENVAAGHNNLTVSLYRSVADGAALIRSETYTFGSNVSPWQLYSFALTDAQVSAITSGGGEAETNLQLQFTTSSESGLDNTYISQAYVDFLPQSATATGGWSGSDRFLYSIAYRFEDDSIWLPCPPRLPNDQLTAGFNLFTVDAANPTVKYTKVTWSNLPIPPMGVKSLILLRCPKIDSTADDNLQLNPYDLRLVDEVDAGTTSYVDTKADDLALALDPSRLLIRYDDDHMMAPRARYMFAGDMRACHSYGGLSPCAIVIAPVGAAADYDRNLADTASAAYASQACYMQLAIDSSGVGTLTLNKSDGTTVTTKSISLTATTTLQNVVDTINNTSFAIDSQQWRAQICPGASPDAIALTALTPHSRAIASCVVSGQTIAKPAGGLSKVAVGNLILGTGATAGAYVSRIDSDTQLTFVGTIAAATVTLTFYTELGDSMKTADPPPVTTLANAGFQRVIANSLPAFLYFNTTYLGVSGPILKDATWMTNAAPGSVKCAPNCFSQKISNRFQPPHESGICTGGAAVDQGFVVLYAKRTAAIRTPNLQAALDQNYRLYVIDESNGCCAWNTVARGNRFVAFLSPRGVCAADLQHVALISQAIWTPPLSDATNGIGDFTYEIPQSVAATASDTDGSYAHAKVIGGILHVLFRSDSNSSTHANRRTCYDFSVSDETTGLASLMRRKGLPWGWSTALRQTISVLGTGRRTPSGSEGLHIYAWNDQNAGNTGDGRIDEIDTGNQDNGIDIAATVCTPWERAGEMNLISGQEINYEHSSPVGSTGSLVYHRNLSDDPYSMTPTTSANTMTSDKKIITLKGRSECNACFIEYSQVTGSARELRKMQLTLKVLPTYKPQ